MPGWGVHSYIDRLWFGRVYWRVHKQMDWPYTYLGRHHRQLFHDAPTACFIARVEYPGDENAIWSALFHILFDELCSSDPEYRKFLEGMAKPDRETRRRARRKPRVKVAEYPLWSFMSKLVELKRLHRAFYTGDFYSNVALLDSSRRRQLAVNKRERKRRRKRKTGKKIQLLF